MRRFIILALCFVLAQSTIAVRQSAAAEKLKLDAEKSKITFVGHKDDGKHEGGFKKFTSEAVADLEDPSNGSLSIEIDTASLWSDDEKLTAHLKNPDFFDVRKHPKISFESTGINHKDDGSVIITGKLTMLGKTEPVEVPAEPALDDSNITLVAKFKLDRTKWGMTYGEGKIHKEVDIVANLVFKR